MPATSVDTSAARPRLFRTTSWIKAWEQVWPCSVHGGPGMGKGPGLISYPVNLGRFYQFQSAAPRGTFIPGLSGFSTEYLCFDTPVAFSEFLQSIVYQRWDQLYLRGLLDQGFECEQLKHFCQERGYQLMRREEMPAYGVNTAERSFEDYCSALGKSTRDRVMGGRKRLLQLGDLQKINMWPEVDQFLDILNRFHLARWGKRCFVGESERFIKKLLNYIVQEGGQVDLSAVLLDGKFLSLMLDIELDGWVYNLQSGFSDENFGRVSLGMVHFGLQIEQAFSSVHCHYYDLLAGGGKSANYKESIANNVVPMGDYYVIRTSMLKVAYLLNDLVKRNRNVRRFPG